jgi:hypothetical protein
MIELCSNALYSNCIQTISNCSAWFVKSGLVWFQKRCSDTLRSEMRWSAKPPAERDMPCRAAYGPRRRQRKMSQDAMILGIRDTWGFGFTMFSHVFLRVFTMFSQCFTYHMTHLQLCGSQGALVGTDVWSFFDTSWSNLTWTVQPFLQCSNMFQSSVSKYAYNII